MFELFDNNIQFLYADNQWFSFVVYKQTYEIS